MYQQDTTILGLIAAIKLRKQDGIMYLPPMVMASYSLEATFVIIVTYHAATIFIAVESFIHLCNIMS